MRAIKFSLHFGFLCLALIFAFFVLVNEVKADKARISVSHPTYFSDPSSFDIATSWYANDPSNILPWPPEPECRYASATGNSSSAYMIAAYGQAAQAFAQNGVTFDWDLTGTNWDYIKNRKVKVTVAGSYHLSASYTQWYGSANASIALSFLPYSYDAIGYEVKRSGVIDKSFFSQSYSTTIEKLGGVRSSIACQAHVGGIAPQDTIHNSSANQTISSIIIQPIPKTYGVFIGISYPSVTLTDIYGLPLNFQPFNGTIDAQRVMQTWNKLSDVEFTPILRDFGGTGLLRTELIDIINNIAVKLQPGDNFVFYFSGHGGYENFYKTEYLLIGNTGTPSPLYKNQLADGLKIISDKGVNVWVILDACFSGGFWKGALENVPRAGLLAASQEGQAATFGWDYRSLFSTNLADAIEFQSKDGEYLDSNHDGVITWSELKSRAENPGSFVQDHIGQQVKLKDGEGVVIFSLDMWSPFSQKSADFDGVFSGEPVPHKSLPWLMLLLLD